MPEARHIRHLTFNTMGAPLKPRTRERFEKIGQLLVKLAEQYDLDVITLQETFDPKMRDRFLIKPWQDRFGYFACTDERGWRWGSAGLTTLSRHEIGKVGFFGFSRFSGVDGLMNKGALLARICMPEGFEMDVYNVHPQASYLSQRARSSVRISQIQETLAFVSTESDGSRPILLTGDLNFEEYNEEYRIVTAHALGFVDVMRALYPDIEIHPLKTLRKSNPLSERKLDHVFLHESPGWQWVKEQSHTQILDFSLSDHRAVMTNIVLDRKT